MNLTNANVVLRPRSVSEVMDLASLLCGWRAVGLFARLAAVTLLPIFTLCMLLIYWAEWPAWQVWLLAWLGACAAQGVFTIAAGQLLFADKLSAREVLRSFAKRLRAYAGMFILSRLYLAASTLLIITVPIVWLRLLFVNEACLLEMAPAMASIKRSGRFIDHQGGLALQMWIVLLLAQIGCVVALELLGHGLVSGMLQMGRPFGAIWKTGISAYAIAGLLLSVAYTATARFLMYIDMRTRADGWDIQVRFMAIVAANKKKGLVA